MAGLGVMRQAAIATVLTLGAMAVLIWIGVTGGTDARDDHLSGIGAGLVLWAGLVTPVFSLIFYGLGAVLRRALSGMPDDTI